MTWSNGPGWRAATLALGLLVALGGSARAQEGAAPAAQEDDEIRRLREEAAASLEGGATPGGGDGTAAGLRQEAAAQAEEGEGVLYGQLLEAYNAMANRLNAFNPRITVFGDFLGRWSVSSGELVEDGVNRDDRIALREVELDLRADIDPYAKGVLILALHEHDPGEYEVEIEEGYMTLETLPFGLRGQLGRWRLPFGQINQLHLHDLPQAHYPLALTDFFGEEGFADNAVMASWLTPWAPIELSVLLLNGENERVLAGEDSDDPAWLGRATYFLQMNDTMFLSFGSSFLFGYNDAPDPLTDLPSEAKQETQVWGADVLYKWQPNQFRSVVAQAEVYGLKKEVAGGREHAFGAYGFLQVQPLQRWYLGARYDWSNYAEGVEDSEQWAASAWISYYTTEFLRFRLGVEHRERESTGGGEPDLDTVYFQVTFVFGSHPVEPFWFNR